MQDLPSEPAAQRDHPHHRGITFGHESLDGVDTWHERTTFEEFIRRGGKGEETGRRRLESLGTIRHRGFTALEADADHAVIAETCDHVAPDGRRILTEERRLAFRVRGATRLIDFDQDLIATDGDVRFDDRKDAGLSIRVPVTVAVDGGRGGRIVNADGLARPNLRPLHRQPLHHVRRRRIGHGGDHARAGRADQAAAPFRVARGRPGDGGYRGSIPGLRLGSEGVIDGTPFRTHRPELPLPRGTAGGV